MRTPLFVVAAFGIGMAVGCSKEGSSGAPPAPAAAPAPAEAQPPAAAATASAPSPADMKQAEEIFAGRCTPCHGPQGRGDGPASVALTPKPRNFTDPAWQAAVTDDHTEKIVLYGGAAVGKSPAMPPNPDLDQYPGVIKGLRAHIRTLKAPAQSATR